MGGREAGQGRDGERREAWAGYKRAAKSHISFLIWAGTYLDRRYLNLSNFGHRIYCESACFAVSHDHRIRDVGE
jgi:hypothetical protein